MPLVNEDEDVLAECVQCGEMKSDPWDFYDGLRCITCCEADEAAEEKRCQGCEDAPIGQHTGPHDWERV